MKTLALNLVSGFLSFVLLAPALGGGAFPPPKSPQAKTERAYPIALKVLGQDKANKQVVWVQPMVAPYFAFRAVEGTPPDKGILLCKLEPQGETKTIDGQTGQFVVFDCEDGIRMGMGWVDFGR